jgi:hypothetical protein
MPTFETLERALFEALRSVRDGIGHHPRLAVGTARAVDRQKFWIRFFPATHDSKNNFA